MCDTMRHLNTMCDTETFQIQCVTQWDILNTMCDNETFYIQCVTMRHLTIQWDIYDNEWDIYLTIQCVTMRHLNTMCDNETF